MATLRDRLLGNGLYLVCRLAGRTARFQVSGLEHLRQGPAADRPTVWVAWHGMTMMLAAFFLGFYDLRSLVLLLPDDWRGATLSVWANKLGAEPFPMNLKGDGSMASARRLAQLVRMVKKGRNCYITPDGPDGPAYVIKPGVAYIARKTGAALLPVGAFTRHGYRLNRWDQYTVPYPFGRLSIVIGPPLDLARGPEDSGEAITRPLAAALHDVSGRAIANYYDGL